MAAVLRDEPPDARRGGPPVELPTPGWGVAKRRAGFALGSFGLTAGLENLFGRLYSEHLYYQRDPFRSDVKLPEPGRNVFVNLSYRYRPLPSGAGAEDRRPRLPPFFPPS